MNSFKYADILPNGPKATIDRHQEAWDGFRDIYKDINSPEKKMTTARTKVKIEKWFTSVASDYITHLRQQPLQKAPAATVAAPGRDLGSKAPADVNHEQAFNASKATVPQLKSWLDSHGLMPTDKTTRKKAAWRALVEAELSKRPAASVEDQAGSESDSELDDMDADNDPMYLASYIFTTYYHNLLEHICTMLSHGDLRCFAGQNFEKMNNDHRLYWQHSNRVAGQEIPSIINQHLRVRMNPIRREDIAKCGIQCPYCSHLPFKKSKRNVWFMNHMQTCHPDNPLDQALIQKIEESGTRTLELLAVSTGEFAREVTDVEFQSLTATKRQVDAQYHEKNYTRLKVAEQTWNALTKPQAG